jgi:hypothetical protein
MLQRCILGLAAILFAPAAYAIEAGETGRGELGVSTGQSIEDCMAMWDPLTHMTKAQWRMTCDRIRAERLPSFENKHVE